MISIDSILSIADFYGWLSIIGTLIGFIYVYRYRTIISRNYLKRMEKDIYKQTGVPAKELFNNHTKSTPLSNIKRS